MSNARPAIGLPPLRPWQRVNARVHRVAREASRLDIAPGPLHRAAGVPLVKQHRPEADPIGGLVEFASAVPLAQDDGADGWLAVHLSACFGQEGSPHQDRIAWVFEREALWRRIPADPLLALEWAGPDVPDPWAALAAVLEWVRFLEVGFGMPSRLPVVIKAERLEGLMPGFSMRGLDAMPDEVRGLPGAVLLARAAGIEVLEAGEGVFAAHAGTAWRLACFLRDGIASARST